jgi:hypothetical protein
MSNILLVEPDYRSKFPPLGLLRLASYHKSIGDNVTFTRGRNQLLRDLKWHKIYVSSLFTYELPRTVKTINYYRSSVSDPAHIITGGIAATLMPDYVRQKTNCRIITGPLSHRKILNGELKPIAKYLPDYSIIDSEKWDYSPKNAYFCRVTTGCIRHCEFCAVPTLEPDFGYLQPLSQQISQVNRAFGVRQNLVLMDNNILACDKLPSIIRDIRRSGFEKSAVRNSKERFVDFNQGIDARLIDNKIAKLLSTIPLSPVRLAFDFSGMENAYVKAIRLLSKHGFGEYTNYVMFNFNDNPSDFYHRIRLNAVLSQKLGIRITSFPMKYAPVNDVIRRFVVPNWKWRYLRGMQCVLLATHGLVSPNLTFFEAAFGKDQDDFFEILSMPDRYIIFRKKYENDGANDWRTAYHRLSNTSKLEFLDALEDINRSREKEKCIVKHKRFSKIIEHYYPGGKPVPCE